MKKAKKLSLEWALIIDPSLLQLARELLKAEAQKSFEASITSEDIEGHSAEREALGDSFEKIYMFPFHTHRDHILSLIDSMLTDMLDTEIDPVYRKPLIGSLEDSLFGKFNGLPHHSMTKDMWSFSKDDLWVTTYEALRSYGFTFSTDQKTAYPPKPAGA